MTDMKKLLQVYEEALRKLRERHDELTRQRVLYDKRVLLLEEEMDEIVEVMCMLRRYVRADE